MDQSVRGGAKSASPSAPLRAIPRFSQWTRSEARLDLRQHAPTREIHLLHRATHLLPRLRASRSTPGERQKSQEDVAETGARVGLLLAAHASLVRLSL